MRTSRKRFRHCQSPSTLTVNETSLTFATAQFEANIKNQVETNVFTDLLINAKELNEFFFKDSRFSPDYFSQMIEKNISYDRSNRFINELIDLIRRYFDKFCVNSVNLRCYIYLHIPSSESANNQGVDIQNQIVKEIQEMETIIESNETLINDYFKKHHQILKSLNKYPHIEDLHFYFIEFERKIFDDLRSILLDLRTIFIKTYDLMVKNLNKIRMPRNVEHLSMID